MKLEHVCYFGNKTYLDNFGTHSCSVKFLWP